jgi:hypothetical protein
MGNNIISIHVTGCHHNGIPQDIDQMAFEFVKSLKSAGHTVTSAKIVSGGEYDLQNGGRFPLKSENPDFYNKR